MISYAQNFEDVLLWRALRHVDRGFYVDVGAADPDEFSVTRWFYEQGWSGVNIEPNPLFQRRLESRRSRDLNLDCAAGAREERRFLEVLGETGLSTLVSELAGSLAARGYQVTSRVEVAVRPLAALLAPLAGRDIHFLKIDVEGSERAVLEGADFQRDRPWIVLIEATEPSTSIENSQLWRDVIEAADYRDVWFDGLNRWFVAAERLELAERIAQPPNVFDDFRAAKLVDAEERLVALSRQVESEKATASVLQAQCARLEATVAASQAAIAESHAARTAARAAAAVAAAEAMERLAALQAELQAVRASTSWRVTRPLRAFRRVWSGRRDGAVVTPNQTVGASPGDAPPARTSLLHDFRQFLRMFRQGGA